MSTSEESTSVKFIQHGSLTLLKDAMRSYAHAAQFSLAVSNLTSLFLIIIQYFIYYLQVFLKTNILI